jgi:hypothetical protein
MPGVVRGGTPHSSSRHAPTGTVRTPLASGGRLKENRRMKAIRTAGWGTGLALAALCTAAGAQDLDALKGAVGGDDLGSLVSGSTGNVAGVVEFCIKNNYLGGDAAGAIKDKLLGKVTGEDASDADKAGYEDGARGLLQTEDGKSVDLADTAGGLKKKVTEKACSAVLDQAKSLL